MDDSMQKEDGRITKKKNDGLTAVYRYRVDKVAGLVGVGYLSWVSFASYLNTGIWYLNYSDVAKKGQ